MKKILTGILLTTSVLAMAAVQSVSATNIGTEVAATGNQLISTVKEVHYVVFQNGKIVDIKDTLIGYAASDTSHPDIESYIYVTGNLKNSFLTSNIVSIDGKNSLLIIKETVLGAGFFVSHPLVVKAAQDANAATTSAQPAATNKVEIEEAFQNGATVADAEKLLEEVAKPKDKAVDAITNKSLTPEEKAELKKAEEAGARTEQVAENGKWITYDGDVLITGDKGKLDKDYLGSHTHILEDGYTYVRAEKNGSLTRHIYSASPTIAKKTMWVDGDSDVILFEEKGFNEKNYVGHHDELLNKGYEFLGADWYDVEGETVTGFVYKKVRDAILAPVAPAPAVAGTSQDNTYPAPAAKAEDKKELPNTGGKDNVAVASLGFLGLLLGALPFVKRKN